MTHAPRHPAPPAASSSPLDAALAHSARIYSSLEALGAEQTARIERAETERLLVLLGERQRLVDEAARAARDLEPFTRDWPATLAALPAHRRDAASARLRALSDSIERIARRDEADRLALERLRASLAAEITVAARARGAVAAYGAAGVPGPRYQDREV